MKISIHQPNFFPWFPFFQKMFEVDVFVLLNHAQFVKGGYHNRFHLNEKWYTMSVDQTSGFVPIKDKIYKKPANDFQTIIRKLPQYEHILDMFYPFISINVATTNGLIIRRIKDFFPFSTQIVDDYSTKLEATDRLVDICKRYKADEYLAGPSGAMYLELHKFAKEGIKVTFQNTNSIIKRPILEILYEWKLI